MRCITFNCVFLMFNQNCSMTPFFKIAYYFYFSIKPSAFIEKNVAGSSFTWIARDAP